MNTKSYEYEVGVVKLPLQKGSKLPTRLLQNELYRAMSVTLAQAHGLRFKDIEKSLEYKNGNWSIYVPGTKDECMAEETKLLKSFEMPGIERIKATMQRMLKKKPKESQIKSLTKFEQVNAYLAMVNISVVHIVRPRGEDEKGANSNEREAAQPLKS